MEFYNRDEELATLKTASLKARKTAQMTVIVGRRRVGKTELVKRFLKEAGGVYFFVERKKPAVLLEEYTAILSEIFPVLVTPFRDFGEFFKFIFAVAKERPLTVVFDEFQNFKFVDPSVFSVLQNHWDAQKKKVGLNLVLVGSLITLMEKIFSGYNEPLFGRATHKIYLEPFSIHAVKEILGDYRWKEYKDLLNFWTVFGGIPKYYEGLEFQPRQASFFEIIRALFLKKDALLRREGFDLLIEEFGKNYQTYFSLLQSVACGANKMSEISAKTGIAVTALSRILESLVDNFKILERRQPIFSKVSKLGRYYLSDNFLAFWFRYIFRFRSLLEIGNEQRVLDYIKKDIRNLQGLVFEKMAQQELLLCQKVGKFIFDIDGIGRYWDRTGLEIDIVVYNERKRRIFFGECKLFSSSLDFSMLTALKEKAAHLSWHNSSRQEFYGLFTIGKMRPDLKRHFQKENVLVWEF